MRTSTMGIVVHSAFLALLIAFAFGVADAIRTLKDGPLIDAEGREYKSANFPTDAGDNRSPRLNVGPTVSVRCTDASMIIVVKADIYKNGLLVSAEELSLGESKHSQRSPCRAVAAGDSEYIIEAELQDCGSKLTVSDDSVIYSNELIIAAAAGSHGITRRTRVVVPVSCHYKRRWLFFLRTHLASSTDHQQQQLAPSLLENLSAAAFSLKLMTGDWTREMLPRALYIGDLLHLEASYAGPDSGERRLFIDSCVATLSPDVTSDPRYYIIENHGCLADATETESNARFLPRRSASSLQLQLNTFLFHDDSRNSIFITCQLKVTSEMQMSSSINKACNYVHPRWVNVDSSDVCQCCASICSQTSPAYSTNLSEQIPEDSMASGTVTLGPLMVFPS
ncbi:zona pellucida sperm-binding protein 3-like isoform X1 [Pungitius pungitius]|uniref:zona pellucida sperm-binding protein 3-like isoform X1 n=1 Tax=Pungitius pungitius TaxID=134920 RepID=UPI002E142C58